MSSFDVSKIFLGIAMLVSNMGMRFVIQDVQELYEKFLSSSVLARRLIVFCSLFVGTRDVLVSVILTFAFTVVSMSFNKFDTVMSRLNMPPAQPSK